MFGLKKGALDSACWFWDTNNINKWCDAMDVVGATKRINGGTIGLDDRKKHYLLCNRCARWGLRSNLK